MADLQRPGLPHFEEKKKDDGRFAEAGATPFQKK
jgi:hypothetical protein